MESTIENHKNVNKLRDNRVIEIMRGKKTRNRTRNKIKNIKMQNLGRV